MMTNDIEWKMVKLGDLFRLSAGGDIDKEHFSEHKTSTCKYPVYSNAIENFGIYGFTSKPNYTGNSVTITGRGNVGYAFFREEPFDAIVRLLVLEPKESNINSYYVASYINQNVEFPIESTGVPQLTIPQIKNVSIPIPYKNGVPDLEAQRQIAQKLGDMDSLIAAKEKLLAKKRNLKVAAMQHLIKDEESEKSTLIRLGVIAKIKTGSLDSNEQSIFGKYAFFTCGEEILKTDKYAFNCDAVLLGGNNATGDFKLHRYNGKFNAYQRVYVITGLQRETLDCIYYIISKWLIDLKQVSTGSTTKFLKKRQVEDILIPFDLNEQRRIALILSDMDSEIAAIEKEITKLHDLKTAMMQKMFCFCVAGGKNE